ncbi:MAG TPA: ATP-grasp domain-containing protein [Solirubrobacteraceae bacterium]|jgi:biotin carboxylase|nr:ATP-grasp domain-containing protein [Solirubrobacteraceae bacterium]
MHDGGGARTILIVCGGILQLPAIDAARDLGLHVVMTDGRIDAPAMRLADEPVQLDVYDVEGHVALVGELQRSHELVGVFCEGADVEVTVAAAAAAAGLPGIPLEAAHNTKNKARTRACLDRAGIPNPAWVEVAAVAEADAAATGIGYPLIVKAVDNCASRGTTRVGDPHLLEDAVRVAIESSTTSTALIEECLAGSEQSVELLFDQTGRAHRLNVVDRPFAPSSSYAIELGHVNPSALPLAEQERIYQLAEAAAAASGVAFGAFKADTILTADGPRILEVTARLSGGFDCQKTTPLASGRNFIRAAMRLACGMPLDPVDLEPKRNLHAAAWTAFPSPGRVVRVGGVDRALGQPGVEEVLLRVEVGDVIPSYRDCATRPAFVIAAGRTSAEAIANAQRGVGVLEIETEPAAA